MSDNVAGGGTSNLGTDFLFQRCEVSGSSGNGLFANSASILRVSHSTISHSGGTGLINSSAIVLSFGNNALAATSTTAAARSHSRAHCPCVRP